MQKIDVYGWLNKLNLKEPRSYNFDTEICYFPLTDEYASLREISDGLRNKGIFLNHKESFEQRKLICDKDEEWKAFFKDLRREKRNVCELSGLTFAESRKLSSKIFGLNKTDTWVNNWLTPHHINDSVEYKTFDKDNILVVNRAIHMVYHMRYYLAQFIKRDKPDYELYFEIGSLIANRNKIYPWKTITKEGEVYNAKNNCN